MSTGSLDRYIDYIKRKLAFIATKEIDDYLRSLGWDPDKNRPLSEGETPKKYKPRKMPYIIQRLIADMVKGEMGRQNAIQINEAKGTKREVKPIEVRIMDNNTEQRLVEADKDKES